MSVFDLQPTTILAFIFTVLLLKHTVAAVGKQTVVDHTWNAYTWLASKTGHQKLKKLAEKRHDLVQVNRERKAISAQDQYARWTKLNRSFDKLSTEIASLAEEVSAEKAKISKLVGAVLMVALSGPIWFSRYWYRKVVLLYFPVGVLPYPVEWFLALPFTKTGGLGLTIWMFAVNSVLTSLIFLGKYLTGAAVEKPVPVSAEASRPGSAGKVPTPEAI